MKSLLPLWVWSLNCTSCPGAPVAPRHADRHYGQSRKMKYSIFCQWFLKARIRHRWTPYNNVQSAVVPIKYDLALHVRPSPTNHRSPESDRLTPSRWATNTPPFVTESRPRNCICARLLKHGMTRQTVHSWSRALLRGTISLEKPALEMGLRPPPCEWTTEESACSTSPPLPHEKFHFRCTNPSKYWQWTSMVPSVAPWWLPSIGQVRKRCQLRSIRNFRMFLNVVVVVVVENIYKAPLVKKTSEVLWLLLH